MSELRLTLLTLVAHHESGHAVAGCAFGFGCKSISLNLTSRGLLGLYTPGHDTISAARELRRRVFGAAAPAAEHRYCGPAGTPFAYDASDDDHEKSTGSPARPAAGQSALRHIAEELVEDPRAWTAVRALAGELLSRFARDGSASLRGDEALAIMDDHGVRPGMRLPELGSVAGKREPWAVLIRTSKLPGC